MPVALFEPHSNSPFRTENAAAKISSVRMMVIEENRTKADLWHYCCAAKWGFNVVATCHSGTDGITTARRETPDIILAGLRPSDLALTEYVNGLRKAAPSAKLILVTQQCSEYLVHLLHHLDFHGLVYEPDETLESLALLIEKVRQGHQVLSPAVVRCQTQLRMVPTAFPKLLTKRHEEVLVCIAHSMTDEEIALSLGVSPATALSHRQKIMQKLNVRSTPKLIRYCIEKGFNMVPPPTGLGLAS